jgi:hypothetical protein
MYHKISKILAEKDQYKVCKGCDAINRVGNKECHICQETGFAYTKSRVESRAEEIRSLFKTPMLAHTKVA